MKGDFSRLRFNTEGRYDRVLMQQGRVQLDSDWNAQAEIAAALRSEQNRDLIGSCGAPAGNGGFQLEVRTALDFSGDGQSALPAAPEAFDFIEREPFTIALAVLPGAGGVLLSNRAAEAGGWSLAVNADLTVTFDRTELRRFHEEVVDEEEYHLGRVEIIVLSEHRESELRRVVRRVTTHQALMRDRFQSVSVRCDGNSIEIRIDGHLSARDPKGHRGEGCTAPLRIAPSFAGQVSDLRMWHYALDPAVLADPRKFAHAAHHHLLAWFACDEGEGDILHDRSGSGHDAVIEGAPAWVRELWIAPGRYYVEGVPCELRLPVRFAAQPDFPGACLPQVPEGRRYFLAYLDSWDRFVTPLEDPSLEEPALGGIDTTGRIRVVAQVKLLPLAIEDESGSEEGDFAEWQRLLRELQPAGAMAARALSRPTLLDNLLYRVEIHDAGGAGGPASFKWSRENGSVVFPVTAVDAAGQRLTLVQSPAEWELNPGDVVEPGDDHTVLLGAPAAMAKVAAFDHIEETVQLEPPVSIHVDAHPFLRRWDHAGLPVVPDQWIDLEAGIQVRFSPGAYRAGDYWTIPSRTALQGVDWPVADHVPVPLPPEGVAHRLCQLALLAIDSRGPALARSYRRTFLPLTEAAAAEQEFVRKSGDHMSGSLRIDGRLHVRGAATAEGGLEVEGGLRAAQDVSIGGELRAPRGARLGPTEVELLRGRLARNIVGTPQIEDGSVTPEKLSFSIGGATPGFLHLRPSPDPVPGYRYTGPRLVFRNPDMNWHAAEGAAHRIWTRGVMAGHRAYLLCAEGDEFWAFEPHTGHFHKRRPLPQRRKGFALTVHDGLIYAIGGREGGRASDRVAVYNPADDSWTERRSLPHARYDLAVAAFHGEIYAVGGRHHRWPGGWSHHVDAFSPAHDRWEKKPRLPVAGSRLALAEHHGHLYALGGERGVLAGLLGRRVTADFHRYDREIGEWQPLPALPLARRDAAAASFNDKIVVLGGDEGRAHASFQEFDPETGVWSSGAPLAMVRAGATAHVHGNVLMLVGGWGQACARWPVMAVSAVYYGFASAAAAEDEAL